MRTICSLGVLIMVLFLFIPDFTACKPSVEDLIKRGLALTDEGLYEEAIQEFNKAIEIDSKDPSGYFYRGNTYAEKGDNEKAIADFTTAIELDPENANSYYNRGLCYSEKRDFDKAIADYTRTIEIDPNYAFAYYNRGLAYGRKGEHEKTIADCTKAIEIEPDHTKSYSVRGIAYSCIGECNYAINDFKKLLELDPEFKAVGEMSIYKGIRIPLSIRYPASWVSSPESSTTRSYPLFMRHDIFESGQLTITEPSFSEIGLSEMSLDEYADVVIATNKLLDPDLTLISQNYIDLLGSTKAKVIVFSIEGGQRISYRLIYIHEKSHLFNMTYTYHPSFVDIRSVICYSFATLHID